MPYITEMRREHIDELLQALLARIYSNGDEQGDYTYCIAKLAIGFNKRKSYKALSHARSLIKDAYDVFTDELLQYERTKKEVNGDLWE